MNLEYQHNIFTMIVGPMFSSKSSTLLSHIEKYTYTQKRVGVFTISKDTRYSIDSITTHTGKSVPSISVRCAAEILNEVSTDEYDVIFIDEIQFFDEDIVNVVNKILKLGIKVIAAGLDLDFAGRPFGEVGNLLAIADNVIKLKAVCTVCGKEATRSQRLIDGQPARIDDEVFELGALETYSARCRDHHVVLEI